jgi:hypothetical protein
LAINDETVASLNGYVYDYGWTRLVSVIYLSQSTQRTQRKEFFLLLLRRTAEENPHTLRAGVLYMSHRLVMYILKGGFRRISGY